MPRAIHKLSAIQVSKIKKKGRYGDGGGLYLRVSPAITKSWVFRFVRNGRATEIGLGPFPTINLGEARSEAEICRKQVYQGLNPKLERQRSRRGLKTFGEVADEYLATMGGRWTNQKTVHQWKTTLTNFCEPIGGTM